MSTRPVVKSISVNTTVAVELATLKYSIFDVPPPGTGFVTVTLAVPAATISAAGTVAMIFDCLTNVVASGDPFQFTVAPGTKPVPFTASVKSEPPGAAASGANGWFRKGTGLFCPVADPTSNIDTAYKTQ